MASWLIFVTLCRVIVTELEKHILDIHALAYVMAERIKREKNLQLLFTARIGFDYIDLNAATTGWVSVRETNQRFKLLNTH